jgi:hypothetical protein
LVTGCKETNYYAERKAGAALNKVSRSYDAGFIISFILFVRFLIRNSINMNKSYLLALLLFFSMAAKAQDEEEAKGGFKKENLFTGGGISLSLSNYSFLVGASPVLGYRLADWADAGLVLNYQYNSLRDYPYIDYKQRQNIYGGGVFTRLFPVRFVFAQAQFEHNFISQKVIYPSGGGTEHYNTSANSLLIGLGYMQGRMPGFNSASYYLSLLWDVSGNSNSPYTDSRGRTIPILRGGVNIPLFQGRSGY